MSWLTIQLESIIYGTVHSIFIWKSLEISKRMRNVIIITGRRPKFINNFRMVCFNTNFNDFLLPCSILIFSSCCLLLLCLFQSSSISSSNRVLISRFIPILSLAAIFIKPHKLYLFKLPYSPCSCAILKDTAICPRMFACDLPEIIPNLNLILICVLFESEF